MNFKNSLLTITLTLGCALPPGSEDSSDSNDSSDSSDSTSNDMPSETPLAGEIWGPCPVSEFGTPDLCNDESLACVPADDGSANICLPIGGCPDTVPLGLFGELGWGDVCYPRCGQDSDCLEGQKCATADADQNSVCAWPIEIPCMSTAIIDCDSLNRCWAQVDGWPVPAQWADPNDIQDGVDAGTLTSVDLGLSAECYTLDGADYHPCVVEADCTPLLGRPASEIELSASDCAAIGGPWSWIGQSDNGYCWGIIDGIAVQLRVGF